VLYQLSYPGGPINSSGAPLEAIRRTGQAPQR